jgi:hypothetical protein
LGELEERGIKRFRGLLELSLLRVGFLKNIIELLGDPIFLVERLLSNLLGLPGGETFPFMLLNTLYLFFTFLFST